MAGNDAHASATSQEFTVTVVGALMIVIAVLSVVLRFYTRRRMKAPLWWDDWMALVAVASAVAAGVLVLAASLVDPDAAWLLTESDPNYVYTAANQKDLRLSFIADCLYFTIVCAAKVSLLLMYHRIFKISGLFRAQAIAIGILVIMFWIATTLATIFNCWPIQWSWLNSLSPAPYCINYNIFWLVSGIIEAVFDIILITLPIGQVMRLQLSTKKKIALASIFLLGACGIITGIIKVIEGWAPGKRSPHWDQTEIWSSVHAAMGILCACLPVCWPLIARRSSIIAPSTKSSRQIGLVKWLRKQKSGSKWTSRRFRRDRPLDVGALPLDEYCLPPSTEDGQAALLSAPMTHIWVDKCVQVAVKMDEPFTRSSDNNRPSVWRANGQTYQCRCENGV